MTILFDDEDLQALSERINTGTIGKINNEVDAAYIRGKHEEQMQLHDSTQDALAGFADSSIAPYIGWMGEMLNMNPPGNLPEAGTFRPSTDRAIPYAPPGEGIFKSNKKEMRDVRNMAAHDLSRLSSGDESLYTNLGSLMSRWSGQELMSPEEVTTYAREQGMDIKVDKPMTRWDVERKMSIEKRKEFLQGVLMESTPYAAKGRWNDATLIAASIAGAVGPGELLMSTAASFVAPQLAVGAIAKGANLIKKARGLKTSADILKDIQKLQTMNKVIKGASGAEGAEYGLTSLGSAAFGSAGAKALKAQEKAYKAAQTLEELGSLTYDSMGTFGKFSSNAFAMTVADLPWILSSRIASNNLETDTYSEQDMAIDTLMALTLGAGLPAGAHWVGSRFGLLPTELLNRRLTSVEKKVDLEEAMGRMKPEDANTARRAIKDIRASQDATASIIKQPHPIQVEAAEQLAKVNTTSDQIVTWLESVYMMINAGRAPDISKLPQNESLLSHISAQVNRKLINSSARDVYGDHLLVEHGKYGTVQVRIDGETGLLGRSSVTALTQEDAEEMLRDMYKGFLMSDGESMTRFTNKVQALNELKETLEDIYSRDMSNIDLNKAAKRSGERPAVTAIEQVDKVAELKEAYIRYKAGDEALGLYRFDNSGPLAGGAYQALEKEAEAFADMWTTTRKIRNKTVVSDFVNPKTREVDNGKAFRQYLDELSEAVNNDGALANTYNVISDIGDAKLKEMLNTSLELGYPDTDLLNLMGVPRVGYEEFIDSGRRLDASRSILSLKRMDYKALSDSEDAVNAMRDLRGSNAGANQLIGDSTSMFSQYEKLLDDLNRLSKEGLKTKDGTPWLNAFSNKIISDETLQERLAAIARVGVGDAPKRYLRHLKKAYKDAIRSTIDEMEGNLAGRIGSRRLSQVISNSADLLEREYRKNPSIIVSLMSKEKVDAERAFVISPDGGIVESRPGNITTAAMKTADRHVLMTLVQDQIEQALIDTELAALNEMDILVSTLALMKKNPTIAGEIITAKATQSVYPIEGAQLSVDYQSMSVGAYMGGLELRLRDKSKNNVNDLWEIFKDKSGTNKNDVMEAITRKIYDENYVHPNSDIAIVANEILDQASSFNNRFRGLGTDYKPFRGAPIDRTKLRYIDALMTDNDMSAMDEAFDSFSKTASNTEAILKQCAVLDEKTGKTLYRIGGELKERDEVIGGLERAIDSMDSAIELFRSITHDAQKRTAYWALRDLDLDAKFNATGNSALPLNMVRDFMLKGQFTDLESVFINDLIYVQDMASSVKSIVRYLIGKPTVDISNKNLFARGWVSSMRAAQNNLGAVTNGKVAAAVARMEDNLPFKDADTALNNVRVFGYNSIEEMVQAEYHNSFQAYYSLKEFGVNPVDTVKELHRVYNSLVEKDGPYREFLKEQAMLTRDSKKVDIDKYLNTRYVITENAARSNIQNVIIACGLENQTPSVAATVIKAISSFFASKLLLKAGFKSFADYSTIWGGLTMNGLASGTGEAMAMTGKATAFMMRYPEFAKLIAGCSVVEQDTLMRAMFNNPAMDGIVASNYYGAADKLNRASRWYGNTLMNNMGMMEKITNNNKRVAGLAISMGIGANKDVPYSKLPDGLQKALLRDGLVERDWEFIRTNLIMDAGDACEKMFGTADVPKGEMYIFSPLALNYVSDDVLRNELKLRGCKNINQNVINDFRDEMLTKTWTMTDVNAQEMISMPSQRVQNWMHMGAARNSAMGIGAEILTQFQSFGAALTYNTYIKYLSNFTNAETGITVMDLFNPRAIVAKNLRQRAFAAMVPTITSIGLATTLVDTTVAALTGNIQKPVDEHGVHLDNLTSGMLGALGTSGVLLNAGIEALGGSGQRGGGVSVQVAPSVSEMTRIGYRITKPIRSSKVTPAQKPGAVTAATAQELAKFTGVPNMPIVALAYQALIGSYLDAMAAGNPKEYKRQLKARERRGYVVFPWQERY